MIDFRGILSESVKGTTQLAQSVRESVNWFNLSNREPVKECNFSSLSSREVAFLVKGKTFLDQDPTVTCYTCTHKFCKSYAV